MARGHDLRRDLQKVGTNTMMTAYQVGSHPLQSFPDELVPTEAELARREGREYEPASELLVRIKAERAVREGRPESRRNSTRVRPARG